MPQRFYSGVDLMASELSNFSLQKLPTAPATPFVSQVYFDLTLNQARIWNSATWLPIGALPTTGFTPAGVITDADTNPAFPAAPADGDTYLIATNFGTVGGIVVEPGDMIVFFNGTWTAIQNNVDQATTALAGIAKIATLALVQAATDATTIVTPELLRQNETDRGYTRKVAVDIVGNNAATTFVVPHNLGVTDYTVQVRETTAGNSYIGVDTAATDANTTTITFAIPPASGVTYRAIFVG